jgi:hypothetical protein
VNENDLSLSITEFIATVAEIGLNISCVECSGPRIPELSDLLSGTDGSEAVTDVANAVFDLVTKLVGGNFLQLATDRALNDATMRCPHSSDYDPNFVGFEYEAFNVSKSENSVSFFVALVIVAASLTAIVLVVVLTTKLIVRRRHHKWIQSLPARQLVLLLKDQRKQDNEAAFINETTFSMFQSTAIPLWVRRVIPVVVLVNIAFFLSGHINLAASVTIVATLGGQTFSEEGFFEFSVARSTIEIWKGKLGKKMLLHKVFSYLTRCFYCTVTLFLLYF